MTMTIIFILGLTWFMNRSFLGQFYMFSKTDMLATMYDRVDTIVDDNDIDYITDEIYMYFDSLRANKGIIYPNIIVFNTVT